MRLRYFNKLLPLWRDSRGLTLIELLVALCIAGMLALVASGTLNQLLSLVPRSENLMVAIRQVQNAGYWVSSDGLRAQVITPGASSGMPLVISWVKWDGTKTTVTYTVTNGSLQRQQVVTTEKTGVQVSSNQMFIAQYITSVAAQYPGAGKPILKVSVTAQVETASATRTYEAVPRPRAIN